MSEASSTARFAFCRSRDTEGVLTAQWVRKRRSHRIRSGYHVQTVCIRDRPIYIDRRPVIEPDGYQCLRDPDNDSATAFPAVRLPIVDLNTITGFHAFILRSTAARNTAGSNLGCVERIRAARKCAAWVSSFAFLTAERGTLGSDQTAYSQSRALETSSCATRKATCR